MRKFLVLFMTMIPWVLLAQQASDLRGSWRGSWEMTFAQAPEPARQMFLTSDEDIQDKIEEGVSSRRYTFNADGSFSLSWKSSKGPQTLLGSWDYNQVKKVLTLSLPGSSRDYLVSFLENGAIMLRIENAPTELLFVETILVKN